MNQNKSLAWYQYPEPEGTHYYTEELKDPAKVEELFDYCQILLATISPAGWKYLIEQHSIEGLLIINDKSGWLANDSPDEAKEYLIYECLISGYNPESDEFGVYDELSGVFNRTKS
ncbi:MAG: hypothetical protein HWE27_16330 [Gammaproteobacteria bacterium]|nr:hypothetical protein [Gammaproteobacteria bacterium]